MTDTIKELVESILKDYPATRDNDFLLTLRGYIRLGFAYVLPNDKVEIDISKIEFAPMPESFSRARREIQNTEQRLQASEETQERRKKSEDYFHSKYSTKKSINSMPNSYLSPDF